MFLPVKADFVLPRLPILTILMCMICLGVFLKQQSDRHDFNMALTKFCNSQRSHVEEIVYERISTLFEDSATCAEILYTITNDPRRDEAEIIAEMATGIRPLTGFDREDSTFYVSELLHNDVRRYHTLVPNDPDQKIAYYTGSWNPITMLTSSFAHGDWLHIIFNLIFFFAFAATVEVLIGSIWYLAFVVIDSLFIGVTGSLVAAAAGEHYWTLGLSGVVMGMIGLFSFLLPKGKIKCFYFFVIIFGSIAVPGWMLAIWYIGSDLVALLIYDDHGVVNVLAHVMGGVGGYAFGIAFLREIRKDAAHIQDDLARAAFEKRFR